ncbi:sensor histidine kinase [Halorhabdus amylolytica]|uniref:sensor histidine kinase n=1 Tax=Halorhabdus amylolytica TaxID=2559573 RepID=UPI0020C05EA8|nr:histidine kinase N-terminal 7TM domain-containing protein [Halorhabdus amylolytica]
MNYSMPAPSIDLLLIGGSLAGGVVCAWLAAFAWHRRDVPAAKPFGGFMVAAGLWSVAYAGALLAGDAEIIAALLVTADIAAAGIPPLWVAFTLAYTGLDRYRRPAVYAVLWAIPIAYAGLAVTAPLHGLVDIAVEFRTVAGVTVPTLVRGVPYWASVSVAYLLVFVGYAILVRFLLSASPVYRRQGSAIVGGSLFPVVGNALFVVGIGSRTGLDPTPLTFALGGVIAGWALFRYDFLSVTPLASDLLLDELPDPVLVLDIDDRIVDHNDAAIDAFDGGQLTGRNVEAVAPNLLDRVASGDLVRATNPNDPGETALFDPRDTEITDSRGDCRGRLIVLRDVTVQQRRMDRIEALQATTERLIEARIDDEVADVAVSFVERVLGQEIAVVFLADEGRLRTAAVSSSVEDAIDGRPPDVTAETAVLFEQYDAEETGVLTGSDWGWSPFETLDVDGVLALSLGEHGLLCIASREGTAYSAEDRQFATILAGATETALDRVAREQQLRESRRVVRHRTEQLEFLNGVLRHNIRNGVQVIDSNAQLLARDLQGDDKERVDRIRERSAELSELTGKIRSITETLTSDGDRVWAVDVGAPLSAALERVEAEHTLTVKGDVDDDQTVLANGLLADVFEAVVRNAAEHGDDASATVEIEIRPMGEWLQVRIADEGPGVSDHLKESLFERDVSVSQTAHGFGLYFVAVMMDLYGGDVWFEDNDPTGAIAVLEFQRPSAEE